MSQQIQDKEFDINELNMQTVKFNKIDKDSQSFHQAFETIRPFKGTLATATGILESAHTAKEFKARDSKDFRDAMLAPIMKNITEAKGIITAGKFSKDGGFTPIQQTLNMLEDYAKFSEERMATSMKLLEDYAGTGANVEINRLATLPILYLTYMGGSGKDKIPHKAATSHIIKREVKVRYYVMNGKRYSAPECFRDEEFLRAVLNSAHDEKHTKLDLSDVTKFANGTYKFGKLVDIAAGPVVKDKDAKDLASFGTTETVELTERLYFNSQVSHIEYKNVAGEKVLVKAPADLYGKDLFGGYTNRGRMLIDVTNPFTGKVGLVTLEFKPEDKAARIAVGGEAEVTGIVLKLWTRMFNQGLKTPIENFSEKHNIEKSVRNGLRQQIQYNEETRVLFNDLANTDILAEALAGMLELTTNVKDQMVFSSIKDTNNDLKALYAAGGAEVIGDWEISKPGLVQGYQYSTIDFKGAETNVRWTENRLDYKFQKFFEGLATTHDFFRFASQAQDMVSCWGLAHVTSSYLTKLQPVFQQGSEVGGLKNVNTVYNVEQAGAVMRIVVSDREERMNPAVDNGTVEVIGYPLFNDSNMENKTFYQYWTFTDNNNAYRSESNPMIPAVMSLDVFDIVDYQAMGATVKLKNITI